jgi:hypothetical protein
MSKTNETSRLDHRELTEAELEQVCGGGTNGGNVVGGWDTARSSGPSDGPIMTTGDLMIRYGRGNAGAIK